MQELLQYSFSTGLRHIPSALSMVDYIDVLFTESFVVPNRDRIVIGKPFGAQAYYLVWQKLGYLEQIESLSVGVKHDEISFVDYSEETIGNALGVGIGIAIANPNQRVWVNLSDGALQMGNTLEAIQYIGHHQIKNIFVTIDYNDAQVLGKVSDILSVGPVEQLFSNYNWEVSKVNGHNQKLLKSTFKSLKNTRPTVVFCSTIKGGRCKTMANDIKKWHYKKIETEEELQSLINETNPS